MTRQRLACVSVDLDEISCYSAIHGLVPPSEEVAHAIYERALFRMEDFFASEQISATLFVIAEDTDIASNADRLRRLHAQGHELGNHSWHHFYHMTQCGQPTIRREISQATELIHRRCGVRPTGFRAPGYTITDEVFEELESLSYLYDSSVFACPAYYTAKAAAKALIRARGRQSQSVLDDPRVLSASSDPYRVGRPYWRKGNGVLEIPIGVTSAKTGCLPFIGTSLILAGSQGARFLTRAIAGRPIINLELHGIDFADATLDGLDFLRLHQPDMRKTWAEKEAIFHAVLSELRQHGYVFTTLESAANQFMETA